MPEDQHWQQYQSRYKTFPALLEPDESHPALIVCIPVFTEPNLIPTLESLSECDDPGVPVEVILLFNKKQNMSPDEVMLHDKTWQDCLSWMQNNQEHCLTFKATYVENMPDPRGGVGWARKLVLDEAARRLKQNGIMLCLDADCTVEKNYLSAVYQYFKSFPLCSAASIYFEHHLEELPKEVRHAITQYELHLRYLVHAMRWAGHPFSYQTVGSSMAVRRQSYLEHGGMNTRQAGEDFYFLQKFIETGTLHEINDTCVYPSPRVSTRVPFGTGRAMTQMMNRSNVWLTTDLEVYALIRPLLQKVEAIRLFSQQSTEVQSYEELLHTLGLDQRLNSYLVSIDFISGCHKIARQTAGVDTFTHRFFRYFNAFQMIKYAHYMRDHYFPDKPVTEAANALMHTLGPHNDHHSSAEDCLWYFRKLDKI